MDKGDNEFKKIKDFINVTWEYEDDAILDLVNEGVAKLQQITSDFDYHESLSFFILKEYVRYAYNGVSMYFEENFKRELLQLQLYYASKERL